MKDFYKTDKPVSGEGVAGIAVSIRYDKGNDSGYRPTRRGYYLSVSPVVRTVCPGYISERGFPMYGIRAFLLCVERKSNKSLQEAERIAEENIKDMLDHVCKAQGCKIVE